MKRIKIFKQSKSDCVFDIVNYFILITVLLVVAYPIIIVISSSFSSADALLTGKVKFLPVDFNVEGYKAVFKYDKIWTGMRNSMIYTVFGTMINIVLSIMAAYPLSRKDLYGRKLISLLFVFTMWFSGGLIPMYLVVMKLNLINTVWAMLLPQAINIFNVIVLRTYFESIPEALYDAAVLDGCNEFMYLSKIAVSLAKPSIAIIALYYGVAHWNSFFDAYLYIHKNELQPIQVILRDIVLMNQTQELDVGVDKNSQSLAEQLKYSSIIVSSIPILIIYPFIQKYLVSGVMIGAVKG